MSLACAESFCGERVRSPPRERPRGEVESVVRDAFARERFVPSDIDGFAAAAGGPRHRASSSRVRTSSELIRR
jgi:hypothetical protein